MLSILNNSTATTLQEFITITKATIQPFAEMPSNMINAGTKAATEAGINAIDLFSHFTADIIKQDVLFTR